MNVARRGLLLAAMLLLVLAAAGQADDMALPAGLTGIEASPPEPQPPQPAPPPEEETGEETAEYPRGAVFWSTPGLGEQVLEKMALNPDTVGWLMVPGTDINREVLHNPLEYDNNFYLNVDFNRQPDKNGTFCADRRAVFGQGKREELSRNTTLYGHSWSDDPDDILFAQLKRWRDPEFARRHPYIFFSTATQDIAWEVFAVFESTVNVPYNLPELSRGQFYDMMDIIYDASIYNYNAVLEPGGKLLTLSTCVFTVQGHPWLPEVNGYRFVIMARMAEPGEPFKQEADFMINASPLSPDEADALLLDGALRVFKFGSSLRGEDATAL